MDVLQFGNNLEHWKLKINEDSSTEFHSIREMEDQLYRYKSNKELTIQLVGDYLLSLRPWAKISQDPIDWRWSAFLSQEGYRNGVMLRLSKQLFLDNILKPEELTRRPVKNPLIIRVLDSIQTGRTYKNQNFFYLLNLGLEK